MIKNLKLIMLIVLFSLSLTLCVTQFQPAGAAEQVSIVSHQGYVDFAGFYNVFGEVKNNGDTPAKNVYLKVTFTTSSGDDEEETEVFAHTVLPGRKSPFMCTAGQAGSTVTSYTIELMDLTMAADDMPKVLEIVSSENQATAFNNMKITGTVKNNGGDTATYVRVYATVYDGPSGTGNVVATTGATVKGTNIASGQTGEFELGYWITPGKTYASYVLIAESDQYAASSEYAAAMGQSSTATPSMGPSSTSLGPSPTVPEFPFFLVGLFSVAILMVAVAVKVRSNKLEVFV